MSAAVRKEIERFTRGLLAQRINRLTQAQRDKLQLVYPDGVAETQLIDAIDLCDRTLASQSDAAEKPTEP